MPARFKSLEGAVYRANPSYRLVPVARLAQHERRWLKPYLRHGETYAILRPRRGSRLAVKTLSHRTARLVRSLRDPGGLSDANQRAFGVDGARDLVRLVWDRVLEIEHQSQFVSGPAACAVTAEIQGIVTPRGRLAAMSIDAIQHAARLLPCEPMTLFAQLYSYNRKPLLPSLHRWLHDPSDVYRWLCSSSARARRRLHSSWIDHSSYERNGWLAWTKRTTRTTASTLTYKLYVSPDDAALPEVFARLIEVLERSQAVSFKVANDLNGLLRPDKCVVYFADGAAMRHVTDRLRRELRGVAAHGVPFTASLEASGLLSWGLDPPGEEPSWLTDGGVSWRYWIAGQLAASLASAGVERTALEPWRFAVERLRLEGVDPEVWRPESTLWTRAPMDDRTVF